MLWIFLTIWKCIIFFFPSIPFWLISSTSHKMFQKIFHTSCEISQKSLIWKSRVCAVVFLCVKLHFLYFVPLWHFVYVCVCLFLQVVVGDRGTGPDSAESADEGGAGRRPRRQNPDESAEHREEERVSQKNHKKQEESFSNRSINQSINLSLALCVSHLLQLRPAAQSETLSPRASSRRPITARLRGPPRLPESPAGRQDGHCCLPAPTPASPCAAVRGRRSFCRIHCK